MSNSLMLKISAVAVAAGAAVMQIPSAEAQTVAVPVSGGGFVVRYDTVGFDLSGAYVTTPTFVTPVGTIAVTGTPSLPVWQNSITIQLTDTPVGVNISGINGSVSLNDGRTATLVNNSAFLQALAKVTAGESVSTTSLNGGEAPPESSFTVAATFRSGSINVPQSAFSPLPPPQFVIPITNGTFTLNIPANQAAFPVFTANNVITPLGTANLTFTFPASVPAGGTFFGTNGNADVSIVVNGTVALSDGRITNINNRLVTFPANARITNPSGKSFYNVAEVPRFDPFTVAGSFSNFNISIPASDITSPIVATQTFQLTQSANLNLATTLIIPDLDDSPLSKRRF